jgi:hypothetical protein
MNKEQLHNLRTEISNLFYHLFDTLSSDQRGAFQNMLINIDYNIKLISEDF